MHVEVQDNPSGCPGAEEVFFLVFDLEPWRCMKERPMEKHPGNKGWGRHIVLGIEQTFSRNLTAENRATSGDSGKRTTGSGGSIVDFSLSPEKLSLKNAGNFRGSRVAPKKNGGEQAILLHVNPGEAHGIRNSFPCPRQSPEHGPDPNERARRSLQRRILHVREASGSSAFGFARLPAGFPVELPAGAPAGVPAGNILPSRYRRCLEPFLPP